MCLPDEPFSHEALLYAGERELVDRTAAFAREGLAAGEAVLVMLAGRKIGAVRSELGRDADGVAFADMDIVGANPARIIPAWREFAAENAGRRLRGVGEPIWAAREGPELVECQRHEALINLAFADVAGFRLLCPYDVQALDPAVVEEARRSHPVVVNGGRTRSEAYSGLEAVSAPFDAPLPEPAAEPDEMTFGIDDLKPLRWLVASSAEAAGLGTVRAEDFVLAVNEVASNSVKHGGGRGTLRLWQEPSALVCEVRDGGRIDQPLIGRERPSVGQAGGQGLWIANQVCDLVQVRSFDDGSAVRLHMRRG